MVHEPFILRCRSADGAGTTTTISMHPHGKTISGNVPVWNRQEDEQIWQDSS